jgi:hypothetical protein
MRRVSHLARLILRRMVKFVTSVVTTLTTRMIVLSGLSGLLVKVKIILLLLMNPFKLIFSLNTWWIDSGATVHVCNSLQRFVMKTSIRKGERSGR